MDKEIILIELCIMLDIVVAKNSSSVPTKKLVSGSVGEMINIKKSKKHAKNLARFF